MITAIADEITLRKDEINDGKIKDKILKTFDMDAISLAPSNTNKNEALSALEVLGFNRKQSEKVLIAILKEHIDASVEVLIKKALKSL